MSCKHIDAAGKLEKTPKVFAYHQRACSLPGIKTYLLTPALLLEMSLIPPSSKFFVSGTLYNLMSSYKD